MILTSTRLGKRLRTGKLFFEVSNFLRFRERICIPANEEIKKLVMDESHAIAYTFCPGFTKIYQDLKKYFQWLGMKRDIAQYVSKSLTC